MYIGTDFVGQMTLPLVAVGEQFTAGFGVDPQLQVKRQMVDKAQTTQGGNQMLRYDYRILVSSYKNEKVKLQVWDRLPQGRQRRRHRQPPEDDARKSASDPAYLRGPRGQNLLRWDVVVEPNSIGEKAMPIQYEFKLELDRQMTISGLPNRRRLWATDSDGRSCHSGRIDPSREGPDRDDDGQAQSGGSSTGGNSKFSAPSIRTAGSARWGRSTR